MTDGTQADQLTERVRNCFRAVFPDLSDEQIETAVRAETEEWDSLASLELLTVIEEEFGIQLSDEVVEGLDTFEAARNAVAQVAA
jgi:acyl carrier protein